jgi:hypothetical protein
MQTVIDTMGRLNACTEHRLMYYQALLSLLCPHSDHLRRPAGTGTRTGTGTRAVLFQLSYWLRVCQFQCHTDICILCTTYTGAKLLKQSDRCVHGTPKRDVTKQRGCFTGSSSPHHVYGFMREEQRWFTPN